jgi:hypothetical protein
MTPIDLPDAAAQRAEFCTRIAGKDAAQVKAIWARLVFTGKVQPPKEVATSADAVKQVASNDKGIAYVDKSAVDGSHRQLDGHSQPGAMVDRQPWLLMLPVGSALRIANPVHTQPLDPQVTLTVRIANQPLLYGAGSS